MGTVNQMDTVNLSDQTPYSTAYIHRNCNDNFRTKENCNQLDFNYKLQGSHSQQSTRAEECNMAEEFAVNKPENHCCRCLNINKHNEILALKNVQKFALRICSGAVIMSHFLICSACQAYPIGEKP